MKFPFKTTHVSILLILMSIDAMAQGATPPPPMPPPPPGLPIDKGLVFLFMAAIMLGIYKMSSLKKRV